MMVWNTGHTHRDEDATLEEYDRRVGGVDELYFGWKPTLELSRRRDGKVLFLHGWSSDGWRKSAFLRSLGYDVLTPHLSDWSFGRAIRAAQRSYDEFHPDVIVGSSRGGAVAMSLRSGDTPLVLLSPAWRWCRVPPKVNAPQVIVIHSPEDRVIGFKDSEELACLNSCVCLVAAGLDHRMNDEPARKALEEAVESLLKE